MGCRSGFHYKGQYSKFRIPQNTSTKRLSIMWIHLFGGSRNAFAHTPLRFYCCKNALDTYVVLLPLCKQFQLKNAHGKWSKILLKIFKSTLAAIYLTPLSSYCFLEISSGMIQLNDISRRLWINVCSAVIQSYWRVRARSLSALWLDLLMKWCAMTIFSTRILHVPWNGLYQ